MAAVLFFVVFLVLSFSSISPTLCQYRYTLDTGTRRGVRDVAQGVEHSAVKVTHGDQSCMAEAFAVWAIFTTGPPKAVVYAVLSVRKCI